MAGSSFPAFDALAATDTLVSDAAARLAAFLDGTYSPLGSLYDDSGAAVPLGSGTLIEEMSTEISGSLVTVDVPPFAFDAAVAAQPDIVPVVDFGVGEELIAFTEPPSIFGSEATSADSVDSALGDDSPGETTVPTLPDMLADESGGWPYVPDSPNVVPVWTGVPDQAPGSTPDPQDPVDPIDPVDPVDPIPQLGDPLLYVQTSWQGWSDMDGSSVFDVSL